MRFRILGPLEVHGPDGWRGIGAANARSVLAALLVRPGAVVSVDRLLLEVWGDRPPKSATTQIHGYVMRLRRALGDPDGQLLVTAGSGYRLVLDPADVDAGVFEQLAAEAETELRCGDAERAAGLFGAALELCRGPVLADVRRTAAVTAEADRFAERRLTVLEGRIDADLACGRHSRLIGELRQYTSEEPLREQPCRQLMLALYRSGRQAEAMQAYRRLRRALVDDLGIEPSAGLQQLHLELLTGDAAVQPVAPVRQLPAGLPDFTGRRSSLEEVVALLSRGPGSASLPVVVVYGGPGVGKSTLALQAARAVLPSFPDGQFCLELAGTSEQPREPGALLGEMLHALGVTGTGIPDGVQARSTLLRSLLSGRRMLMVLDDAASADQVRPLLPPDGDCAVVVTARRLLTDLAGARHVELDVLAPADAAELFAGIVGPDRVAAEPEHAAAIVRSCGLLPLAIRIAAGKLTGRPAWSLRVLRDRLGDESRRLGELRLGDLGVRASFDLSLRQLPDEAVRGFQLLGLLGPLDLPGWVLGPLLGRPRADDVLDALVDANLLRLAGTDRNGRPRYRMHDLLCAYAREGAGPEDEPLRRALTGWLQLATTACEGLPPSPLRAATAASAVLDVAEAHSLTADAGRWFDAERPLLLAAVRLAAGHGFDELAWSLASAAVPYYDLNILYDDWQLGHGLALRAVVAAGNERGEAVLRRGLAAVQIYRDRYADAATNLDRALLLFQRVGDKRGEASVCAGLTALHRSEGRIAQAFEWAQRAAGLAVAAGDRHLECHLLCSQGVFALRLERPAESRVLLESALLLADRLGDLHREAVVLRELSQLDAACGDLDLALEHLERAADIFAGLGDERCIGVTLLKAGRVHSGRGDRARAVAVLEPAAAIFTRNGSHAEAAMCWELLGDLASDHNDLPAARDHLTRARDLRLSAGITTQAAALTTRLRVLR